MSLVIASALTRAKAAKTTASAASTTSVVKVTRATASTATTTGTSSTTYAVNVVLLIARHIEINDQSNIVNVYATRHNIRCHKNICLATTEREHHFVTLGLRKITVHGAGIITGTNDAQSKFLSFFLGIREDNDTMGSLLLKQMLYYKKFLRFVTDISTLAYVLRRLAYCKFHFNRIVQDAVCQTQYITWHSGTEHNCLMLFRQGLRYEKNVIAKAHVEHAVCLIKNKKRDTAEIYVA